jgi:hypothetical protein
VLSSLRSLTVSIPVRRPLSAGVVLLYALVCSGLPIPTSRKPAGTPFPCAGRACGCATADACWAGACCCFSAREKLAWATAHDYTPPAHFLRAVERELEGTAEADECPSCAAKKACAANTKPTTTAAGGWLVGLSALKCKGQAAGGPTALPPSLPTPAGVSIDPPPAAGFARAPSARPVSRPAVPPVPPPRVG